MTEQKIIFTKTPHDVLITAEGARLKTQAFNHFREQHRGQPGVEMREGGAPREFRMSDDGHVMGGAFVVGLNGAHDFTREDGTTLAMAFSDGRLHA